MSGNKYSFKTRKSVLQGRKTSGFTLLEAIILTLIVGLVAVAAGVSLRAVGQTPSAIDDQQIINAELISELDTWRATAFTTVAAKAGTTTNDTVTLGKNGQTKTFARTLTVATWDPTDPVNNTTPQTDFLKLQLTIGGRAAVIWITQP